MRRRFLGLLIIGLAVTGLGASDQAAPGRKDESFEALKKEYDEAFAKLKDDRLKEHQAVMQAAQAAQKAAAKALEEAKTEEEKQAAQEKLKAAGRVSAMKMISAADGPGERFSPRFLAFALAHPDDPAAFQSLTLALQTSGGPTGKAATWTPALKYLRAQYVTKPDIKRLLNPLAAASDPAAKDLVREVMARNPDRKVQARACKALAASLENAARLGAALQDDETRRKNAEGQMGKARVEELIAHVEKYRKEAADLSAALRDKYSDVLPDLSVGKPAPEVVNRGLDGQPVRLSALKGKVVVLDIWATWCGPCRAMIPHEREMVERFKDKPFVLVSISTDENKETLTAFLGKVKMPWTHWWNGHDGGIIEDWDVQFYPTIYVLDAQGTIRYKNLRDKPLEEAVGKLLAEAEAKKTN